MSGYTDEDKQRLVSMENDASSSFFLCYTCLLEIDNEAYNAFFISMEMLTEN